MENKIPKKTKKKRAIELLALFLILLVLPIGTWYYTRSGFQYFKSMTGELHQYGQMPAFSLEDHNGELLELDDVKGRLVVSSFMSLQDKRSNFLASQVAKLYDQFKDRDDVVFLFYTLNPEKNSVESLNKFAQANGLTDEEQCFFLTGDKSVVQAVLSNGYKWPSDYGKKNREEPYALDSKPLAENAYYPYVVLADTSLMIRNYYAFEDNKAMARLVEHLALLLPNRGKGKPVMKREEER